MTLQNAIPSAAATERWHLTGPSGPESWIRRGNKFVAVELGTSQPKTLFLADNSFELEQLRMRETLCSHQGPFPNGFLFCPECGAKLAEAPGLPAAETWPAPFGTANGLPVLDRLAEASPAAETRRQEMLPVAADLGFVVAGTTPALFAYDLSGGMLRVRRESDGSWQDLEQLPRAHRLPRWSWSAAMLPQGGAAGFVVATNAGPVLVQLSPDRPLRISGPPVSLSGLGGPAVVDRRLVMPVRTDGGLALAVLSADGQSWTLQQVPGGADCREPFAVPVVHYSDAFWCSAAGLLSVCLAGGTPVAAFLPWAPGLSPALAIRPLQAENGTLYQLMRRGEQDPVFHSLVLPDREAELRPYRLCFSAGNAVFADGKRRRLPWEETGRGEFPLGDDEFVLPLLAFSARRFLVAVCAGRSSLTRFIETAEERPASRACRLYVTPATRKLVSLERRFDVPSAWDIVPFVFRGRLFLYAAGRNECFSWALELDPQT